MKLKDKLYRFMYGRYGVDQLSKFMLNVYLFLALVSLFVPFIVDVVLLPLSVILISLVFFRMLSKNIYKRQWENAKYLSIKRKFTEHFKYISNKWKFRKTHVYKKCPSCKCKLKLPRKKGTHTVKCPKCSNNFSVKIR